MNEKLIYCSTNRQNSDVVDVTIVENGKPRHGQVRAQSIAGWLETNANLGTGVNTGAGVGHERKSA